MTNWDRRLDEPPRPDDDECACCGAVGVELYRDRGATTWQCLECVEDERAERGEYLAEERDAAE